MYFWITQYLSCLSLETNVKRRVGNDSTFLLYLYNNGKSWEGGGGKHTSNKYRTKKDELKRKRNAKRSRNRTDSDTLADINDM